MLFGIPDVQTILENSSQISNVLFDNFFYFVVGISVGCIMLVYVPRFVISKIEDGIEYWLLKKHHVSKFEAGYFPKKKNGQIDWDAQAKYERDHYYD